MAEWHKLSDRLPEVKQIVLVMAGEWLHPRVLRYEVFPFQRLIDRSQGIHFWYPERMQWTPCPMPSDGVATPPEDCEAGTAPRGKCSFGPHGWRGTLVCRYCGQAPSDGVSLVDGESSCAQTPIPSPMDSEREG